MRMVKWVLILAVISLLLFSYKLTEIPNGLTVDEAAFGYNANLLANTLHDQNGRFLPIFVLSLNGRDWRQPVTQYFITGYFKLFGASVYNLRFTSVLIASLSVVLAFILGRIVFGLAGGLVSSILVLTTPIVMMHSHLGLDNIMPIPFVILWLIFLHLFEKKKDLKFLIFCALSLGVLFYTYKGARAAVPVFTLLTVGYLFFLKIKFKQILIFLLTIFPFYAITPLLELKYAGAVFNKQNFSVNSSYSFLYFYLSSFDLSFLFIKGDELPHHSTSQHGMFLLSTLPMFLIGIYRSLASKNKFLILLSLAFVLSPLLTAFVGSVHRASRLMYLVPIYALVTTVGFLWIYQLKRWGKLLMMVFVFLLVVNFADFLRYYWSQYADATKHIFYQTDLEKSYKVFFEESKFKNLTPYISKEIEDLGLGEIDTELFLRSIYFPTLPEVLESEEILPENGILLTSRGDLPYKKVEIDLPKYFIYTNSRRAVKIIP